MNWILYLLVFIFGYVTCQTFYFLRSARLSLSVIKCAELISLLMLARSVENYEFTANHKLKKLMEAGFSDSKIEKYKLTSETEITIYKEAAVATLLLCYNDLFRNFCKFDNWESAMKYLQENKNFAYTFLQPRGTK